MKVSYCLKTNAWTIEGETKIENKLVQQSYHAAKEHTVSLCFWNGVHSLEIKPEYERST